MDLKRAIKILEHTPISKVDLKRLVPKNCDVVKLDSLKGRHRSEIFKNKRAIVVLLPSKVTNMGHWVCLTKRKNHIELVSCKVGTSKKNSKKW